LSSEEKWEDEEKPNLLQKIINKVLPPKKPRESRVKKTKNNKSGGVENIKTKEKVESLSTEQPVSEQPEAIKTKKTKKEKESEKWVDTDKKKSIIPNLGNIPIATVTKRIIATLLLLGFVSLLVFVLREPMSVLICLLTIVIFVDYLSITGQVKTDKWND